MTGQKKNFLKGFSKKELSKKRKFEITLMIGAVILILIIVPVVSGLIYRWNSVRPQGSWERLVEEDYNKTIASSEFYNDLDMVEQTGIVWGNETDHEVLVVDHPNAYVISWALNFRLDDLYQNNTLQWRFSFNVTDPIRIWVFAEELTGTGEVDWCSEGAEMLGNSVGYLLEDNGTVEVSWTALDLMTWSAETGNGILVVSIVKEAYMEYWTTGDQIGFRFSYEEPPDGTLKEKTFWQWGAGIMGVCLLLVAFGSTPWWNPLRPKEPGWVDRKIGNLRRKKNGKSSR